MSLFDDIPRTSLEPRDRRRISAFDYLNESARPSAARVRDLMECLLARYPEVHREELCQGLRSTDEGKHTSVFFELLVHELLLQGGCSILAVEPEVPGTNRSPDFLVETPEGTQFYLEATLATGRSQADEGAQRRMEDVLAAIDAVDSPDFFLAVYTGEAPARPVRVRRLRERVQAWVDGLDYDAVAAAWQQDETDLISLVHEEHGARFRIEPIPRQRFRGERGQRAVGLISAEGAQFVQGHAAIREAVKEKAGRYGNLDRPYVVAVNALVEFARGDHAIEALFGREAIEVRRIDGELEYRNVRNPDGAWYGPRGPQNTRVSAVLSTEHVSPWNLRGRRARLVLNPWARQPLAPLTLGIDQYWVTDGRLVRQNGRSIGEVLGLTPDWPEPD